MSAAAQYMAQRAVAGGVIVMLAIGFPLALGLALVIAAGSALTVGLAGKTRAELAALTASVIEEALGGLRPESRHAAVLCVDAVRVLLGTLSSE